jgi:hypothetical protein
MYLSPFRRFRKTSKFGYSARYVCLFVHVEQLSSQLMDFHKILYLSIFRKSAEKIKASLNSDQNKGYFT